jgi:hypothetical protein
MEEAEWIILPKAIDMLSKEGLWLIFLIFIHL